MWISKIKLENIRGFAESYNELEPSQRINIIVGRNNSGKSTILKSILLLIRPRHLDYAARLGKNDVRQRESFGKVIINFYNQRFILPTPIDFQSNWLDFTMSSELGDLELEIMRKAADIEAVAQTNVWKCSDDEFNGFVGNYLSCPIVFHLSKRNVTNLDTTINPEQTNNTTGNYRYLIGRIDELINRRNEESDRFEELCRNVLNFSLSLRPHKEGRDVGLREIEGSFIPLTAMGEGVIGLLGLLRDLCDNLEEKIFLIEEPENDVHPRALKQMLDVIKEKSATTQFFISTHSNIVMKHLGSVEGAKVFNVSMEFDGGTRLPLSKVCEVSDKPMERIKVLEDLGYEPYDYDQWKGWLFLEESSAERIIRDFLIPQFVPQLRGILRTYSAGSRDEIEVKFKNFKDLFVFVHLEERYKNRAWVVIDADGTDKQESEIIKKMQNEFTESGWNAENFRQFSKHDFEEYYPKSFQTEIKAAREIANKRDKRDAKKALLDKVIEWYEKDTAQAKREFGESAKEVIGILEEIAEKIA